VNCSTHVLFVISCGIKVTPGDPWHIISTGDRSCMHIWPFRILCTTPDSIATTYHSGIENVGSVVSAWTLELQRRIKRIMHPQLPPGRSVSRNQLRDDLAIDRFERGRSGAGGLSFIGCKDAAPTYSPMPVPHNNYFIGLLIARRMKLL